MSEQEFWKGEFGDEYHTRQKETEVGSVKSNEALFRRVLTSSDDTVWMNVKNILEFGAGEGLNNEALHNIFPTAELWSVEINEKAASHIGYGNIIVGSALDRYPNVKCDLVFTKGLMIHLHPEDLPKMYEKMYQSSNKYIMFAEYYAPKCEEIKYRGNKGRLWRNDFAGQMMDLYPDLELIHYEFFYHRDKSPQDDLMVFLLEKKS